VNKLTKWVVVLSVLACVSSASAQNPAGATEATQAMNFMQLVQAAMTAENQLMTAQMMVEQGRQNMERLSRGDVRAIRDVVYQAMMVQSMVNGFMAAQQSATMTMEYSYPSPQKLDGRFQTWGQYHRHLKQVEVDNHRTFTEAARVLDMQIFDGLREDGRLLQRLREKAGTADSEAKQLQVTNQILIELVRQMHLLRTEGLAAHRMQLFVAAADSQRRVAEESASESLLQPKRLRDSSSYPGYTIGGKPTGAL